MVQYISQEIHQLWNTLQNSKSPKKPLNRHHLRECYNQIYHINIHVHNTEATVDGPHFTTQSSDWSINFSTQYKMYLISKNTRQLGVCSHQSTSYQKFYPPDSATSKIPAVEVHRHMVHNEWQMGRNSKWSLRMLLMVAFLDSRQFMVYVTTLHTKPEECNQNKASMRF